jgi:hypothetical protein
MVLFNLGYPAVPIEALELGLAQLHGYCENNRLLFILGYPAVPIEALELGL